ncbi:hypothetical protein RHOER0001_2595 [Rhodococcus erythropolis SK121]|nr:hypothetical protein RHOER0001_2595 [Rhodococcus erythropolis SK121]
MSLLESTVSGTTCSRTKLFVNSARYAEPDGSATVDSF